MEKKKKVKHYFMLVNRNGNPPVLNGSLPIYWLKSVAEQQARLFHCQVVRVEIYFAPFETNRPHSK